MAYSYETANSAITYKAAQTLGFMVNILQVALMLSVLCSLCFLSLKSLLLSLFSTIVHTLQDMRDGLTKPSPKQRACGKGQFRAAWDGGDEVTCT